MPYLLNDNSVNETVFGASESEQSAQPLMDWLSTLKVIAALELPIPSDLILQL